MIQGHGDDLHRYASITSNFSSNIYTKLDLRGVQQHLCTCIESIHSYPEPDAHSLAQLLAGKLNISTDNILLTNGATEAIYQLAHLFEGSRTTILIPTFSEYKDACRINKMPLSYATTLDEVNPNTQLLWFCNPNNPTGTVYPQKVVTGYIEKHPHTMVIIDQSYAYFTRKEIWTAQKAAQYPNVMLLHSMTKQYAIPGLRLGYVTAHKSLIDKLRKYSMPWSVNGLAIEAGKYLLSDKNGSLGLDINAYLKETQYLQQRLNEINGLTVLPTDTHFFLCRLDNGKTAAKLKEYLANEHGILIRNADNFRGLDERYFRIATQSPKENKQLVNTIRQWM